MTLSLAGRCDRTGMVGCIICSSSIAVSGRCLWGSPAGVVLSQNLTDPYLGILGLRLLEEGYGACNVLEQIVAATAHAEWRQLAVLDINGNSAVYTGLRGLGTTGTAQGSDCVSLGNLLANEDVPTSMVRAFEATANLELAERLLKALDVGVEAGGELGPLHSSGLRVYHGPAAWPIVDLRIDWSEKPVSDLRLLWDRYAPQMNDYVLRARHPDRAPSYRVPGDL